jgi:Zn-dependent protease with chaperone function
MIDAKPLRVKSILTAALSFAMLCILVPQPALARVELQPCKNNMLPEKQIELGNKAAQQVYKEMPVLPDSSPVTQYVQALGAKLVENAPGYHWPYNFHVVNVEDINAFALPGGSIFVNLGTIQAAGTEAQLAGVMAHEISHVILQHSVCNLAKQQRVGIMAGLGQIASSVLLGDSAIGTLAESGIGLTAGLSFLKMSRGAEKQADLEGVGILYDTGYDPRAMPQFFETVQAKYGNGGAQFLNDHPNPGNRTEYINQEIATFPPQVHYTANTPQFRDIHKQVAKMHAYTQKEVSSGVWKRQSPNQAAGPGPTQPASGVAPDVHVDTSAPRNWTTFKGNGFSMEVPANWLVVGGRDSAQFAPPNGISQEVLVYGLLTDTYNPEQPASLRDNFNALVKELARRNPGLQPGQVSRITVADAVADSSECTNPSANNNRGEHDWIVGFPVNSAVRYVVFVAPERDFKAMRPTFERILNSLKLQ